MKIVFIILIVLLILRLILFFTLAPHLHPGQSISFTTMLSTDPTNSSRYNRLTANYQNFWSSEKILITYAPFLKLKTGDTITISGTIDTRVIGNKNTVLSMYFPHIERVKNQQNLLVALMDSVRQNIAALYDKTLSTSDAGLLLGIVLGVKATFTKQFQAYMQSAGVLHVIAASGMNVSMTAGFLFRFTASLFRRQVAIVIAVLGVIFYMLLAGLQASIVRAGLMAMLAFGAQLFGRQYTALYSLALVAGLMLMLDPSLLTNASFQLSVGATFGILVIRPLLPKHPAFDDLGTTLSAQVMTLPILLGTFGTYGLSSVLVNFLVLWTVPILMILGGVGAIIGSIFTPLGSFFIWLCAPLLWYFTAIVTFFGSQGWNIQLQSLPISLILGYYLIIFALLYYFHRGIH